MSAVAKLWTELAPLTVQTLTAFQHVLDREGRIPAGTKLRRTPTKSQKGVADYVMWSGVKPVTQVEIKGTDTGLFQPSRYDKKTGEEDLSWRLSQVDASKSSIRSNRRTQYEQSKAHLREGIPTYLGMVIGDRYYRKEPRKGVTGVSLMTEWDALRAAKNKKYKIDVAMGNMMRALVTPQTEFPISPAQTRQRWISVEQKGFVQRKLPDVTAAVSKVGVKGIVAFGEAFLVQDKRNITKLLENDPHFIRAVERGAAAEAYRVAHHVTKPATRQVKESSPLYTRTVFSKEVGRMSPAKRKQRQLDVLPVHVIGRVPALEQFKEHPVVSTGRGAAVRFSWQRGPRGGERRKAAKGWVYKKK